MIVEEDELIPSWSRRWILQDRRSNHGVYRIQALLALFRLAQVGRYPFDQRPRLISYLLTGIYRVYSELAVSVELPVKTHVGERLKISHGFALVINERAVLGSDVILRQCVTIGERYPGGDCPLIGDRTSIGSGACVLGAVSVGAGSKIGANSVVLDDVPAGASVAGVPAQSVGRLHSETGEGLRGS